MELTVMQYSAMIGQWVGVVVIITGIFYEKKYKAHWGFVFITAGSLVFALGTKLLGF